MNHLKAALLSAAPLALLVAVQAAGAQGGQGVAPANGLPPGPGRDTVARACSNCHGIEMTTGRRDTPAGWAQVVDTMIARGAQLTPAQFTEVVAYLSQHFPAAGSASAASAAPAAAAPSAVPSPAAAPAAVAASPGVVAGAAAAAQPSTTPAAPPPIAAPGLSPNSRAVTESAANSPSRREGADWPSVNLTPGATRFSTLTQINARNVSQLREAWTYETNPNAPKAEMSEADRAASVAGYGLAQRARVTEVTPLVVDGVLYTTTPFGQAVALEGHTGREIWKFTLSPEQGRPGIRSLSYWEGGGETPPSIYFSTTSGLIIALEARTGRPVTSFGDDGVLDFAAVARGKYADLTPTLLSPPVFYKNIMITGMSGYGSGGRGPLGTTRGWDAATGKLLWEFHGTPQPGEPGHETWVNNSWMDRGGAYSWGLQSVDVETGTVFVPLSTAHYDYYGGDRPGDNLYGSSLVALDATTGKLKWHFQTTHHDLWDADLHHAPVLITVKQGIKTVPGVAVATKRGLMFMFDRNTGKPIHPVEERRVPTDGFVPTEVPSPTQPFPVRPGPLARDHFTPDELARITPEHGAFCENMLMKGRANPPLPAGPKGLRTGGAYLPYDQNGSIVFPWTNGGAEWQGMSFDPNLGYLYVLTAGLGEVFQSIPNASPPRIARYPFRNPNTGWPCSNGPWGEMIAVNVNTGVVAWRRPIGDDPRLEALGINDWGTLLMGGPTSTAGGITFAGGTIDGKLRAVDSESGKELWEADVGAASHSMTITYLGRDGRQYVAALISGGGLLGDPTIPAVVKVFALPRGAR